MLRLNPDSRPAIFLEQTSTGVFLVTCAGARGRAAPPVRQGPFRSIAEAAATKGLCDEARASLDALAGMQEEDAHLLELV